MSQKKKISKEIIIVLLVLALIFSVGNKITELYFLDDGTVTYQKTVRLPNGTVIKYPLEIETPDEEMTPEEYQRKMRGVFEEIKRDPGHIAECIGGFIGCFIIFYLIWKVLNSIESKITKKKHNK